mmetsp:Transcript_64686/g.122695  ORF Transcript_64686/g.122695 Transcript_64686/m.122695 type:complete len:212 (-) Transcript_64686:95-730(-)
MIRSHNAKLLVRRQATEGLVHLGVAEFAKAAKHLHASTLCRLRSAPSRGLHAREVFGEHQTPLPHTSHGYATSRVDGERLHMAAANMQRVLVVKRQQRSGWVGRLLDYEVARGVCSHGKLRVWPKMHHRALRTAASHSHGAQGEHAFGAGAWRPACCKACCRTTGGCSRQENWSLGAAMSGTQRKTDAQDYCSPHKRHRPTRGLQLHYFHM